ncbi:MAG: YebC/PmpR family DNA-binding transcriptional regulator [bacterium]|nr:YebC/PmpR family DNA-binding transcriptional regulator [bacterium]
MSGHSKWAQIKRKKAVNDKARGKLFTRLLREITVAARQGGGDPDGNARLRLAVQTARDNNMPQDNIQRAMKKATGESAAANFEEITYEAYGPGGVALLIDAVTDNRNRTGGEVRHALTKHDGRMGETGSVAWVFETKGIIWIAKDKADEETIMEVALEAGAEDVSDDGEGFEVVCPVGDFESVRRAISEANIESESAAIQKIPRNIVRVEGDEARRVIRLMEALEDLDDVQSVSANFDIPGDILQEN